MHACMHTRIHKHTHTHTCRGCKVRTCDYAPRTEDPIKTQIKTKLFKYYYLVFRAVRALRWRHLELPEFVPCVLNRWRHTHPILIIAYMPIMLFYVKQLLTNRKIVQTAWMTKSNYIFLRTLARFNPPNWQLDSFLFVFWWWFAVVCGGLRWFACFPLFSLPIVPNSGGDLWWFAVICAILWWFVVVCGGLW